MQYTEDTTDDETLKRRLDGAAILARMLWLIMQLLHDKVYGEGDDHVIETTRKLHIMSLILINDHRKHRPPLRPSAIEEMTGIPRKSATRYLEQLVKRGMVKRRIESRKIDGYVVNHDFFKAKLRANYFKRIVRVIHITSGMMLKLMS